VLFFGPRRALVALRIEPPVLVVRAEIGQAPEALESSRALYRKLLELNATELLHVAYGLDRDRIVLSGALELESVDLSEIEATLSDIDLALSEHVPALQGIVKGQGGF
jgi:hypothetical protein